MTPRIVIHGGAGTIEAGELTPERAARTHAALRAALEAGHTVLRDGGSSLDAVERAVIALEDEPLFNAGRGAVLCADGTIELDAAIMDGARLAAGAVTCVRRLRNPVSVARLVMERSRHVLLAGTGAEAFAAAQGVAMVDPAYFRTEERVAALERVRAAKAGARVSERDSHGTVGAVALDAQGRLAAATSTGGRTNKLPGRVGDTPLIGAGTFANQRVAVSGTGSGEHFMRHVLAHALAALVEHAGMTLAAAADRLIHEVLPPARGSGGLIALDRDGNLAMPFNTEGMYRAWVGADGAVHSAIHR